MGPFSPVQERGQRPGEGQGGVRRGQWRQERRGGRGAEQPAGSRGRWQSEGFRGLSSVPKPPTFAQAEPPFPSYTYIL